MQIYVELSRQHRLLPSAQGGLYIDCKVWNALDHSRSSLDHSPKTTSLSAGRFYCHHFAGRGAQVRCAADSKSSEQQSKIERDQLGDGMSPGA